jgi:zinc protease
MDSSTSSESTAPAPAKETASAAAKSSAKPAPFFPYEVHRTVLDNGVKVLLVPTPADGLVAYWSVCRTGSRDEVEEGVTGFAHFFEHMMFRGTEKLPHGEYDKVVNGMGADANAFTTDDFTAYHLSFAKDDLPKVIEIEADRFQNLKYAEDAFKTESGAVYGEYRKGRTNPFEVLEEAVRDAAYDKHTYKHTTIGFVADIERMPTQYEYSKTFFQRFYRPENLVIVVTGDFDPTKALAEIKKQYGGWKKGYTAPKITPEPVQTAERRIDVPYDYPTLPIVALNFKGAAFDPTDKTMVAAMLIAELGFGETSPAYKKLVLDEQRAESLEGDFGMNRDPGLWSVVAMVKEPNNVKAVERDLWAAIDELRKTPVSAQRLDDVRSHMKYRFLSRLSTPNRIAGSLARFAAITGDISCIDQMYATLATVTPDDVRRAADQFLVKDHCTVAILHSKDQAIADKNEKNARAGADTKRATIEAVLASGVATDSSNANALAREFAFASNADAAASEAVGETSALGPRVDAAETGSSPSADRGTVSQPPVLLQRANDQTVAFKIWFQVGSQDDPPGKEGLAALTSAMISEGGTASLAYDQILQKLFPLAASYQASTDREMTVVSGEVHKDNADRFASLLIDAIVHPGFRTEDFDRLRAQTISFIENNLRSSSDEELGKAALYEAIFKGTPYGHIEAGTVAALKSITLDDVKSFYKSHWTRENVVVGLGGAFTKSLADKLQSDLGELAAGKPQATPESKPASIEGRHALLVEKGGKNTSISFGCPIDVHRGSRDYYALWIANSWLGEHRNSSSHLYNVIREKRGMNYGDYSYVEAYPNGGRRNMPPTGVARHEQIFEGWIRTLPRDQAVFALRAGLREVDHLANNGLTKEQFEFTKRFLKGYTLHFAEDTADKLGYAIDDRFYGLTGPNGGDGDLARWKKMLGELTNDDVSAALKKHLSADNLQIAMVTDKAADMKTALVSDAPSPITYKIEQTPEILAEDKEIERFPLKIPDANVTIVPVKEMFAGGAKANG